MPSYKEVARIFGMKSKAGAFKVIQKLIDEKFLRKSSTGILVPGVYFNNQNENESIKLLGLVEAGFPTPANEDELDRTTLDEYLVRDREATFMLKVKGDSMYDAGIREGDMVLVERTNDAKPGKIVVAEVDGAWTIKYLRKGKLGVYLEPANKKYKPIYPKEELRISAVVTAVIRKYF